MGTLNFFKIKEENAPRFYELMAWVVIGALLLIVAYKDKNNMDFGDAGLWDWALLMFGGAVFVFLLQDSVRAALNYDSFDVECDQWHDTLFYEKPSHTIPEQYYIQVVDKLGPDGKPVKVGGSNVKENVKIVLLEETGIWCRGGNSILRGLSDWPSRPIRGWHIFAAPTKFAQFAHGTLYVKGHCMIRHPWDRDKIDPLVLDGIRQRWPEFDLSEAVVYEFRSASDSCIIDGGTASLTPVSDAEIDKANETYNVAVREGIIAQDALRVSIKRTIGGENYGTK